MSAEITPAAVVLLALLAALLLHDYTSNKRRARDLWLQAIVFVVGGALIVYPEIARRLAHYVGIGRGVDFVLYPLVIWLVRESLLSRRRRHEDEEKITELVRALAMLRARQVSSPPDASPRAP
jgi:small membrane protein